MKNPQRNIPLAVITGVLILILLYCGANAAYYLIIPRDEMKELKDTTVATEFCFRLLGPVGAIIASAIVMTSVFGALNGNLLVGPRLLYAMGHDRLAPARLSELHPRYKTPVLATIVLAAWSCLLVLGVGALVQYRLPAFSLGSTTIDPNVPAGKSPFDIMTDFAIFGAVCFETLAVASIFVFRRRIPPTPENRPYRCWGYPFVPMLYVAIMAAVIVNYFVNPEQRSEALTGLGFIALGACVYLAVFRGRPRRHSRVNHFGFFLPCLGGRFSFALAAGLGLAGVERRRSARRRPDHVAQGRQTRDESFRIRNGLPGGNVRQSDHGIPEPLAVARRQCVRVNAQFAHEFGIEPEVFEFRRDFTPRRAGRDGRPVAANDLPPDGDVQEAPEVSRGESGLASRSEHFADPIHSVTPGHNLHAVSSRHRENPSAAPRAGGRCSPIYLTYLTKCPGMLQTSQSTLLFFDRLQGR